MVRNTPKFKKDLCDAVSNFIQEFTADYVESKPPLLSIVVQGFFGDPPAVEPHVSDPRYVVRAETPDGPVYLRSLQGSLTEWTSELRYAKRYDHSDATWDAGEAFNPDATRIRVRKLRPSPGYHVYHLSGGSLLTRSLVFVSDDRTEVVDPYTETFVKRHVFKTKRAAKRWVRDRKLSIDYQEGCDGRWEIVAETAGMPRPVGGDAP